MAIDDENQVDEVCKESGNAMPKVEEYKHGTPCWVDLTTTDLAGARAFYAGLFGWEYVDEEMGEMDIGVYSMAMLGGSAAAAIYKSCPGQIRPDGAAKWNLYVSVDDVDDVVGRVAASGGNVLAGSKDVDRAGRVAVIADPTGCVITLWEPGEFVGCGVVSEAGAFSWSEHLSTDRAASVRFFEQVFGIETATAGEEQPVQYSTVLVGDKAVSGIMQMPDRMIEEGVASEWYVYFQVADFDRSAGYVMGHGGRLMAEPGKFPGFGRMVVARDPQGADFCIVQPETA